MRYTKQILFEKIGSKGQERISKASIAILGLGATGSRSAELLARAGIGSLTLIDRDIIEESNLQRQALYNELDIALPKVLAAKSHLEKINSKIKIKTYFKDINSKNIDSIIKNTDLILDCTDNMQTRFLLNEFCVQKNIPWIYCGIIESAGMLLNIIPKKTPCLRCLVQELNLDSCDTLGILNSTAAFASSLQVTEALKQITSQLITKELLYFDVWKSKIQKIKIKKQKSCPVCNRNFSYLNKEPEKDIIRMCGNNIYQLNGPKLNLEKVSEKLKKLDEVKSNKYCLIFRELIIFEDGRILIRSDSEIKAKSLYNQYIGY